MPGSDEQDTKRPFAAWLRELSKGRVHDQATDRLAELVTAIQETGKKGELTIKITVKPQPKMDGRAVLAEGAVTAKIPTADPASSLFFVDGASLVRNDPEQQQITGLQDVSAAADFSEPRRTAR